VSLTVITAAVARIDAPATRSPQSRPRKARATGGARRIGFPRIKTFHGDYRRATERGRELLFAAGDPDEIELACEAASVGCQDAQALYVFRHLLTHCFPLAA